MSKPNKIQYNGNSKIIAALVNVGNWLLDNGAYTLPIASASRLGGIKVGQNLTITEEGVLNAQAGGGSDVSVTPIVTTGTKIAKITITEGTSDADYNLFAPTPSTVNDATITIKKNNTTVDSFTLNQSSNKDINISVPTVTDAYDGTSSEGMSGKAVKSAIDALDVTTSGAAASKTVTALSQTDGKISATFSDISITKSQISDFPTKVSSFTNDSGYVTTDEKITPEDANPSSDTGYLSLCVPALSATTNQKPKAPSGYMLSIKNGTSSAVGHAIIRLGNSTASGSANNKFGKLRLFSQKTKYVDLVTTADMTTADRTITLPDADGTIALTSDIKNSTITIKKNGTTVDSFTLNQSTGKDIDISVPTKTSDLTNDSGYITSYTDEKITPEDANPSSDTGYLSLCVPALSATTNQKPKAPSGYMLSIKNGTSSAVGHAFIRLGNGTASGSANNKCGKIRLYSQKTKYVDLVTTANMTTADRTITLPDKDGTIALTADLTTYAFAQGTNNGEIKITPSVGGTAGTAVTVKPKGISDLAYIAKGSGSSKFLREDGTWQTVTASWSGGQVTSNIYPNATGTLKVGTISRYFSESYVRTAYVNTCVVGYEGEVTGSLYLSRAEGYSAIITAPVLSANVALTLPSASGTLINDTNLAATTLASFQPTAANAFQAKTLSESMDNFVYLLFEIRQYGNTLQTLLTPVSRFKGQTSSGNRVIMQYSNTYNAQIYYSSNTQVYISQTNVSSGVYYTVIYGVGRKN